MSHEENRQLARVIISRKEPTEIDQCYAPLKKANVAQQTNFSDQWRYSYIISIYTVCTKAVITSNFCLVRSIRAVAGLARMFSKNVFNDFVYFDS